MVRGSFQHCLGIQPVLLLISLYLSTLVLTDDRLFVCFRFVWRLEIPGSLLLCVIMLKGFLVST